VKPKVTIGVCVKNSAATLCEAIESIICQDFPHELMEVIFVDDGSHDETLPIIESYVPKMDMSVKVFHHEWRGLGPSRNLVVNEARGDYIIWVDGDMVLPKDHVWKNVEFMECSPTIGIGKARPMIYSGKSLVGILENAVYVAAYFKYGKKATSRTFGTGGSIYRVKAIRQIGGFDVNIRGVGEDLDAEHRTREAGWLTYMGTPAMFYERPRRTLKDLWLEGFWHGYGGRHMFRKNKNALALHEMTPMAGFLAGVWYSTIAYGLIRRKIVFLLPIQYTFKRLAWCLGFVKSQVDEFKR